MIIRALIFSTVLTLPFSAVASGSDQFLACEMPVLEYTTGNLDDEPESFYSDSVEWVIESYPQYPKKSGLPNQYEGWIVLIKLVADGDDDLEDYVMNPEGLAQVKFNGTWMLQADFERMLCNTNM